MRIFIFILLSIIGIKASAQSSSIQEIESYANELIKNEFLTEKGKTVLLREIKNAAIDLEDYLANTPGTNALKALPKEIVIRFCCVAIATELMQRFDKKGQAIEAKITPKEPISDSARTYYPIMDGFGARKEYQGSISPKTSTFGFTRIKTLVTFLKVGLIDEKIFNDCQAALKLNKLRDEVELLRHMLYRSIYYNNYELNKAKQVEYLASLVASGIISGESKDLLLKSYKEYELKTIPEILLQSKRYTFVDLHNYPPDPQQTYPVIFNAISKLLPDFKYSDLNVRILEQKEGDLVRQDISLSFVIDSNRYVHSFFHDYCKENPRPDDPDLEPSRVDPDFHKGVNKWLTDIESPFRLYTVNIRDEDENVYGHRSVGMLLLKKGEDTLVSSDLYVLSNESFDQRLSKKNIDKLLSEFSKNGFFNHLTRFEIDSAREKIASTEITGIEDVLNQFPKTLVVFDWETGNLENPYEELSKRFMEASRGAFVLTGITDEFKKGWKKAKKVKYGFTMNGKRYERMLTFDGDWLDPEFMELLKKALADNNIDGRIYYFVDDGQVAGYIFLTSEQYKFVKESYPDLLKGD